MNKVLTQEELTTNMARSVIKLCDELNNPNPTENAIIEDARDRVGMWDRRNDVELPAFDEVLHGVKRTLEVCVRLRATTVACEVLERLTDTLGAIDIPAKDVRRGRWDDNHTIIVVLPTPWDEAPTTKLFKHMWSRELRGEWRHHSEGTRVGFTLDEAHTLIRTLPENQNEGN